MAKRRANGEGNIRKRKDGRWEGRYTAGYDPETGKQIFKNVLGRTQAEVKDKLNAALEELKRIDVIVSDQMTTGEWLDTFLRGLVSYLFPGRMASLIAPFSFVDSYKPERPPHRNRLPDSCAG